MLISSFSKAMVVTTKIHDHQNYIVKYQVQNRVLLALGIDIIIIVITL